MRRAPFFLLSLFPVLLVLLMAQALHAAKQPNIVFMFSDDHAVQAISAYGSKLNKTPNIDRIASQGVIFRNSFCTNSICGPSRASILTGKHSQLNGFRKNGDRFDGGQVTFPKLLQQAGYQTAIFGKWHLGTEPTGFDEWMVYPGQGSYYNPDYRTPEGKKRLTGYSVEVTTDLALKFLKKQTADKPFLLMCQYKAPHRNWMPGPKYLKMYDDVTLPEPETLFDDYKNRAGVLAKHKMGIDEHMTMWYDLKVQQQPGRYEKLMKSFLGRMTQQQRATWDKAYGPKNQAFVDANLKGKDLVRWKYQRYLKDYLRCIAAVDDGVGRILDELDALKMSGNTIVIYSSDQGFYLGEHGWFDKRWIFEESLRMPLVMRWPEKIKPGTEIKSLVQNIDYAPTFLEAAGADIPEEIQGRSLSPLFNDAVTTKWRKAIYYHYYEAGGHGVAAHYGVRGERYKLIHYPKSNEWDLIDLKTDPLEMRSQYNNPEYAEVLKTMKSTLTQLRNQYQIEE